MNLRISGRTLHGRAGCGHKLKNGQTHYVVEVGKNLLSVCELCARKDLVYKDVIIGDVLTKPIEV